MLKQFMEVRHNECCFIHMYIQQVMGSLVIQFKYNWNINTLCIYILIFGEFTELLICLSNEHKQLTVTGTTKVVHTS